jgi:hypothetical protein
MMGGIVDLYINLSDSVTSTVMVILYLLITMAFAYRHIATVVWTLKMSIFGAGSSTSTCNPLLK